MIALTTSGCESASPMPSSPVSVRTRTMTASWLLAVLCSTCGMRRSWQTISVIFMFVRQFGALQMGTGASP